MYNTETYQLKPLLPKKTIMPALMRKQVDYFVECCEYELFQQGIAYYYAYDRDFKREFAEFIEKNWVFIHSKSKGKLRDQCLADLERLERIEGRFIFNDRTQGGKDWLSAVTFNRWFQDLDRERKAAINAYYPQKDDPEFHAFLTSCLEFLRRVATYSFEETNSMLEYVRIGKYVDWFLQTITDCRFHKHEAFRKLFTGNVVLKTDRVAFYGIMAIFNEPGALKLIAQNQTDLPFEDYLARFETLFESANEVVKIYAINRTKELEHLDVNRHLKEKLHVMHEIGVAHAQIHEME